MLDKNTSNWLKVFAACLVVASHYSMYLLDYDISFPQVILRFNSALLGKIGVAFFFLMSGYGLSESCKKHMDGFWPFLYRRVAKIYLPALVASFFIFLITKRGGYFCCTTILQCGLFGCLYYFTWFLMFLFTLIFPNG